MNKINIKKDVDIEIYKRRIAKLKFLNVNPVVIRGRGMAIPKACTITAIAKEMGYKLKEVDVRNRTDEKGKIFSEIEFKLIIK